MLSTTVRPPSTVTGAAFSVYAVDPPVVVTTGALLGAAPIVTPRVAMLLFAAALSVTRKEIVRVAGVLAVPA